MYGRKQLRESLASSDITIAPGVYDGISARLVEQLGFETGFLSGAGVSNGRLSLPDMGFLNLSDIEDQSRHIAREANIPIWVDADTGYGNAVNVHHTVRRLADAGAAAVMIEDQEWPKRCGHMAGKSVLDFEDSVSKIEAAAAARDEVAPDMLIKARTDAAGTHNIDEAIRRLNAFADAGADILFPDAVLSEEHIRRVADELDDGYFSINMGFGIRERPTTPLIPAKKLEEMGVDSVIYPRLITAAATMGMKKGLESLQTAIETDEEYEDPDRVVDWEYYMDLVGQSEMQDLEDRFAAPVGVEQRSND